MTTKDVELGPRLVGSATGTLRAALLVQPNASIARARPLAGEPGAVHERALEQHEILRKTLAYFGVELTTMSASGDDPFESAVVDAAVVVDDAAIVMRPTAMTRRAEADRVEAELRRLGIPVAEQIAAPGLLDGGDILLADRTAFIGVGPRGNELGRIGFARFVQARGFRVVEVPLAHNVPSLRSVATAVARDMIVLAPQRVDRALFEGFRIVEVERGEESAAGLLCLSERHVIADVRYRTAFKTLRKAGITVEGIDLYDFEKVGITPSLLALALKRR